VDKGSKRERGKAMRKCRVLLGLLVLTLLVVASLSVMLTGITGRAQEPRDGDPASWTDSTLPVPVDAETGSLSPPDRDAMVDPLDRAPSATYDASLRIAGSVLRPRTSDVEWRVGGEGGCIYSWSGSASTWWNTPLYLPQNATIKYFRMYYNDQSTVNSEAYLTAYDLFGDIVEEWGVASSGTGEYYATTEEFTHTVDYSQYSYVVNWRPNDLSSDMQGCGFRIYYQTPPGAIALPIVLKGD
jgi:hypothetical protein